MIRLRSINKWLRRIGLVLVVHEKSLGDRGYEEGAVYFYVTLERNNPCIPLEERRWVTW